MAILFRCPECEHKLRAADAGAGLQSRCKCGALVTIPAADETPSPNDDTTGSTWQLKPRFSAAGGDLCEAITAWSPLCAKKPARIPSGPGQPTDYWQGILVGAVGVLVVSFVVIGIMAIVRYRQAEPQLAQETTDTPDSSPPSSEKTPESNGNPQVPPAGESSKKSLPLSLVPKDAGKPDVKNKGGAVGTKTKPPKGPSPEVQPKKDEPKPVPVVPDGIEIVDWYTTVKVTIIGDSGKEEPLEPQEEAVKAEWVFIAVKARLPAKMLQGKKFDVEKSDAELHTPSSKNPFPAFGCAINDKLWFAPEKGQYPYPAAKDGIIIQSWLFIAPLKDLQSGRTTFQLKDQPAVLLTLETRREP